MPELPEEPSFPGEAGSAVEVIVEPRARDLGGFEVRRALPSLRRRSVGPFVFLDRMGPATFGAGAGLDVRPHPHIGLATVTYLLEGELLHRDSLGNVQVIRPGAVNWMTSGSGIAHSERTPPGARAGGGTLSGVQAWVALPRGDEETAPGFAHTGGEELPVLEDGGARLRVVVGALHGARSPVRVFSPTLLVDARLEAGARLTVPAEHEERAAFVVEGTLEESGAPIAAGQLAVLRPRAAALLRATTPARLLLLGGDALAEPRHIWWNVVSSSRERIEQAAADWAAGRFAPVPGETELIPLPERPRIATYP
jgi:redox-sensitive bicupin YhaK (pirin superfamily)